MMNAKLDFSLSNRFGVVERTIFRLVLNGINDVKTITGLLTVFSDEVIANAIKRLVNFQVLHVDLEKKVLSVSDVLLAIIDRCLEQSNAFELPEGLLFENENCITDEKTKKEILQIFLPSFDVGFLVNCIDFVICERGAWDEQ